MKVVSFSKDFIWGVATSSYQIEGAWEEDGKGESIWDRFSHTPGKIEDRSNGDTACDHYHRWADDIGIMRQIGAQAYRFSIAWSRILPTGRGEVNQKGLDFYSRLVDGLLEADITPFITLYHWDLPQTLQDQGGWPARSTAEAFVEYAGVVTRALGDRVKDWMTFNEPFVSAYVGHWEGRHAPGHQNAPENFSTAHHLLLAHGKALPVIRENVPGADSGIVLNMVPQWPASSSLADKAEAYLWDGIVNRWYLDPLAGRGYPADIIQYAEKEHNVSFDFIQPGDIDAIATPVDFLGVNYYTRRVIRSTAVPESDNTPRELHPASHLTEMGWEVYPEGLVEILVRLHFDYHFPAIYITENGVAYPDTPNNGKVNDQNRVAYYDAHLQAVARAIAMGVPVLGYFAWSLMDNFEWAFGYTKQFGLVYVDFETQQRILKSSAHWYRTLIDSRQIEIME